MCQHHIDVVRSSAGAFIHPHALRAITGLHELAASAIGRVPGLNSGSDRLRAFPGVALPVAGAPEDDGDEHGGGGGGDGHGGDDGDDGPREPDYAHMGDATRDAVLCMCPSTWLEMTRMALLFPDAAHFRAVALLSGVLRGELPDLVIRRCRAQDISPVEAWTRMEEEYVAAEREGRAVVSPIPVEARAGAGWGDPAPLVAGR